MSAKVRRVGDSWYVVTHHRGIRRKKSFGKGKAAKREAERNAKQLNEAYGSGRFCVGAGRDRSAATAVRSSDASTSVWTTPGSSGSRRSTQRVGLSRVGRRQGDAKRSPGAGANGRLAQNGPGDWI